MGNRTRIEEAREARKAENLTAMSPDAAEPWHTSVKKNAASMQCCQAPEQPIADVNVGERYIGFAPVRFDAPGRLGHQSQEQLERRGGLGTRFEFQIGMRLRGSMHAYLRQDVSLTYPAQVPREFQGEPSLQVPSQ